MTTEKMTRSWLSRTTLVLLLAGLAACAPQFSGRDDNPTSENDAPAIDVGLQDEELEEGFDADSEENIRRAEQEIAEQFGDIEAISIEGEMAEALATSYSHLDPMKVIRPALLQKALAYFDKNKSKFANKSYITVVDFQRNSSSARFHVVNMTSGVVQSYYVAHGKGSDSNNDAYAEKFSNVSGSGASSIGPVKVAEIYSGKYGRSVRIDGLASTNSNMRRRAVVIHGSNYVKNSAVKQGRSLGCFALPMAQKDAIITKINGGSLLYADQVK